MSKCGFALLQNPKPEQVKFSPQLPHMPRGKGYTNTLGPPLHSKSLALNLTNDEDLLLNCFFVLALRYLVSQKRRIHFGDQASRFGA